MAHYIKNLRKNIKEVKRKSRRGKILEIIIEISIFAVVTLIVLILHHFIIEDKEIYVTRKEIEDISRTINK